MFYLLCQLCSFLLLTSLGSLFLETAVALNSTTNFIFNLKDYTVTINFIVEYFNDLMLNKYVKVCCCCTAQLSDGYTWNQLQIDLVN